MVSAAESEQGPQETGDELAPGTELLHGQYTIVSFLNAGGFGITYRAVDSLDRKVVIKECFPGAFCRRSRAIVQPRSRAHTAEFDGIVRLFVEEARSLSKLQHPNIVGVHQVFEENDTAYMALDFVEGRDLLDILEDPATALPPDQIVSILDDMLDAIRFVHGQGMLHRDISPDNILMDPTGRPVLIDFGAARQQAQKQSRVLSAMRVVKDGYSPQEFYITGSEQGPFSDLYALGASFYHLIAGDVPPDSQRRLTAIATGDPDPYEPLAGRFPDYEANVLASIDKALSILPKDRMQSAAEWMGAMSGQASVAAVPDPLTKRSKSRLSKPNDAAVPEQAPRKSGGMGMLAAGVGVLALAAGGGWFVMQGGETPAPEAIVAQSAPSVPMEQAPERIDETSFAVATAPATVPVAPEATAPQIDASAPIAPEAPDAEVAAPVLPEAGPSEVDVAGAVLAPVVSERPLVRPAPAVAEVLPEPQRTPGLEADDPRAVAILSAPRRAAPEDAAAARALPEDATETSPWSRLGPFLAELPGAELPDAVSVAQGGWTLALPYEDLRVDAAGRSWVLTVDGVEVADRAAFDALIAADHDLASVDGVDVVMGIGPKGQTPSLEQTTTLAAAYDTTFPGGPVFRATREEGDWVTRVIALPEAPSDLQVGDVLLGSFDTGLPFAEPGSLAEKIDDSVAAGEGSINFAVARDGSTWVASLPLPAPSN